MKCPYCNNEMEKGFIQTGNRIAWTKQQHKFSLLPKEGEVMLGNNMYKGVNFPAYICKKYKKVLLDYSDNNYKGI